MKLAVAVRDISFEAGGDDFVEVKIPLYPAIELTDAVMTDTFDFQPQFTTDRSGAGYWNPSSFQIISAGSDDMGRSFDLGRILINLVAAEKTSPTFVKSRP